MFNFTSLRLIVSYIVIIAVCLTIIALALTVLGAPTRSAAIDSGTAARNAEHGTRLARQELQPATRRSRQWTVCAAALRRKRCEYC